MIKVLYLLMSRKAKLTVLTIFIVTVCSVMLSAFAVSAISTVTVIAENKTEAVRTISSDPADIIEQAGFEISKNDFIDISEFSDSKNIIRFYKAHNITVTVDGIEQKLNAAGKINKILSDNGITLKKIDKINCSLDSVAYEGQKIVINKAFAVTFNADGKSIDVEIAEGTVADALKKTDIAMGKDDYTEPALDAKIQKGMTIEVFRVSYKERSVKEAIAFKTVEKKSDKLYLGDSETQTKGKDGSKEIVYTDKFINGKKIESVKKSEAVILKAVDKVVLKGTKTVKLKSGLKPISELTVPADVKINKNGVPESYSKVITGTAKAYYGNGTTATGRKTKPGYIAVDPKQIPYGTELWVVSSDGQYVYGYAIAADTGGFVKKKSCTVDLFFNTKSECYQWGHRGVTIYVL